MPLEQGRRTGVGAAHACKRPRDAEGVHRRCPEERGAGVAERPQHWVMAARLLLRRRAAQRRLLPRRRDAAAAQGGLFRGASDTSRVF